MPELSRAQTASRSAWLELREELRLVNDGYEFLDEKRILLASEMLRQRDAYRIARKNFASLCADAAAALVAAAADQGLDGLQVYPVVELSGARVVTDEYQYVGQIMLEGHLETGTVIDRRRAVRPSPEVRACRDAYSDVLAAGVELAALEANLERLMHEYRRTERRVRALEHVVLPEIREDLATMDEHLAVAEQEEVLRARTVAAEKI